MVSGSLRAMVSGSQRVKSPNTLYVHNIVRTQHGFLNPLHNNAGRIPNCIPQVKHFLRTKKSKVYTKKNNENLHKKQTVF